MKITKSQLKRLIKEELAKALKEVTVRPTKRIKPKYGPPPKGEGGWQEGLPGWEKKKLEALFQTEPTAGGQEDLWNIRDEIEDLRDTHKKWDPRGVDQPLPDADAQAEFMAYVHSNLQRLLVLRGVEYADEDIKRVFGAM